MIRILFALTVLLSTGYLHGQTKSISTSKQKEYLNYLLPLSQKISVKQVKILKTEDIGIILMHQDEKSGKENVAAIKTWSGALKPTKWHHRVNAAIKGTEETVKGIKEACQN